MLGSVALDDGEDPKFKANTERDTHTQRERERALLLCTAGGEASILTYICFVGLTRCVVHL